MIFSKGFLFNDDSILMSQNILAAYVVFWWFLTSNNTWSGREFIEYGWKVWDVFSKSSPSLNDITSCFTLIFAISRAEDMIYMHSTSSPIAWPFHHHQIVAYLCHKRVKDVNYNFILGIGRNPIRIFFVFSFWTIWIDMRVDSYQEITVFTQRRLCKKSWGLTSLSIFVKLSDEYVIYDKTSISPAL